ncbi:flagellar protein essential for flagellar pocket biogenesis [Diplonema papillatum]|nr:flagellar protein essential for flagellar pocket biogenesis [Diplonema papillatum]
MQTFKVRVACDLYGSKHNAMFLFKPPPVALSEIVSEAQRFYQQEAETRKPASHPGPAFQIVALQLYNQATQQWEDVSSVSQLTDGCQLYAFQLQTPWHSDGYSALPDPLSNNAVPGGIPTATTHVESRQHTQPGSQVGSPQNDAAREAAAFDALDLKKDGVVSLDEMSESFVALGLRFSPAQVQDLFTVADEDGDGVISRAEFGRFAARFPSVIDSLIQKRIDDAVTHRGEAVLREAETALAQEQEVERQLLDEAASASKRVRDLMGQIADHKMNQEVALQRKPVVEAQQQQLVEQELALAAQKERLRQAKEEIRRDFEEQLNQVSSSIAMNYQSKSSPYRASPQTQQKSVSPLHAPQSMGAHGLVAHESVGGSSNTSSFFLPSESPKGPRGIMDAMGVHQPHYQYQGHHGAAGQTHDDGGFHVGAEVEACNFTKPEFNGLRGRVVSVGQDGKIAVQLLVRGGLHLNMQPSNLRVVHQPTNPPLGSEVEAVGPALNTTTHEIVDLRSHRGRVVGWRGGCLLCEFPPRAGIFEVKPHHLTLKNAAPPPPSAGAGAAGLLSSAEAKAFDVPATPTPQAAAALARLGNLAIESSSPLLHSIATLPTSPMKIYPPPTAPLPVASLYPVGGSPTGGAYASLLPSTHDVLKRMNVSMSPVRADAAAVAAASAYIPSSSPLAPKPMSYALGPIDPAAL